MLLAMVISAVNNRRNQALHQATLSLFYAAFGVEMWTRDRSLVWTLIGAFLVFLMALCAIDTYVKNKRNRCDANSPSETPVEFEGKSNGC